MRPASNSSDPYGDLNQDYFEGFDPWSIESPAYVISKPAVERNLRILSHVRDRANGGVGKGQVKILAALKAFVLPALGPLVGSYLDGTTASGPWEAVVGRDYYGGEVHAFSAAFKESDIDQLGAFADHLVFNSPAQALRFGPKLKAMAANRGAQMSLGLRVNPAHSEGTVPLYDPCAPFSRLGTAPESFDPEILDHIQGLHFHTLCEQDFLPLKRTFDAFEKLYGQYFDRLHWLNLGGGHHITLPSYQRPPLIGFLSDLSQRTGLTIYLEPGEAVAIRSGVLVAEVLDLPKNGMNLAILDISATAHMPDVLEMPYRPEIRGAGEPGVKAHTYRLGGMTCLAGDVIGDYSFDAPLQVGDRLMFDDMAHYTMVKTTMFNGVAHPDIVVLDGSSPSSYSTEVVRRFTVADFTSRFTT